MRDNDNGSEPSGLPLHSSDAHGQAALVLVESLIHGLIERSVLTTLDAVEIIERAEEVQADAATAADGAGAKMWQSHGLLSAMSQSLQYDIR